MNDIADHEAQFHDHGEQVDAPYPQIAEHPLRVFLAEVDTNNEDGTYKVTEQIWTGAVWTDGTAPGNYVGAAARDINKYATCNTGTLILCWEQYVVDGAIELVCDALRLPPGSPHAPGDILYMTDGAGLEWLPVGGAGDVLASDGTIPEWTCQTGDELVAVDAEATPGYLGAGCNDGVLRVDGSITYTDGGNFITLSAPYVATADGEMPGYLENVTAGHDPWIVLTEAGGVITWTHGGPGDTAYSAPGVYNVIDVDIDCWGHVRIVTDSESNEWGPCVEP